jgi:hypothetical protein
VIGMLRICSAAADLPRAACPAPGRCEPRWCFRCGGEVHYDPRACLPAPVPGTGRMELVICIPCAQEALS